MFHKVLVAEDLDSISITVGQVLKELSVSKIHHSKYCDDALLKIKKAQLENVPYELLISDLSFKADSRKTKLKSGEELIEAVKQIQPNIKIVVFSIEDKSFRIKSLFNNLGINAYVSKGRESIPELKKAIQDIFSGDTKIISPELSNILVNKALIEIEMYDIDILKLLSLGYTLDEISCSFKTKGIIPNGTSSIEKRINKLKTYFNASNNAHLMAITKDLGLV
jgi:two-component system capsular synthesis response regulator RcsB